MAASPSWSLRFAPPARRACLAAGACSAEALAADAAALVRLALLPAREFAAEGTALTATSRESCHAGAITAFAARRCQRNGQEGWWFKVGLRHVLLELGQMATGKPANLAHQSTRFSQRVVPRSAICYASLLSLGGLGMSDSLPARGKRSGAEGALIRYDKLPYATTFCMFCSTMGCQCTKRRKPSATLTAIMRPMLGQEVAEKGLLHSSCLVALLGLLSLL